MHIQTRSAGFHFFKPVRGNGNYSLQSVLLSISCSLEVYHMYTYLQSSIINPPSFLIDLLRGSNTSSSLTTVKRETISPESTCEESNSVQVSMYVTNFLKIVAHTPVGNCLQVVYK